MGLIFHGLGAQMILRIYIFVMHLLYHLVIQLKFSNFLWISRAHKIHENLNPTEITNRMGMLIMSHNITCSEKAVFDNKKAIRGGVPIVFRQSIVCALIACDVDVLLQLSLVAGSLDLNTDSLGLANGSYSRSQLRSLMISSYNNQFSFLLLLRMKMAVFRLCSGLVIMKTHEKCGITSNVNVFIRAFYCYQRFHVDYCVTLWKHKLQLSLQVHNTG